MKEYILSDKQWAKLWLETYTNWQITGGLVDIGSSYRHDDYLKRVNIFLNKFPNLYYRENPEYYGVITYHDDKDLTFFLLQL